MNAPQPETPNPLPTQRINPVKLLITCDFEDGTQVLIKDPATDADIRALARAKRDTPDAVLGVVCKTSETGPSRERLIRAGLIRSLELA